jgi:hypothetical protein
MFLMTSRTSSNSPFIDMDGTWDQLDGSKGNQGGRISRSSRVEKVLSSSWRAEESGFELMVHNRLGSLLHASGYGRGKDR